jgi:beta-lactamase regulating signal transducer with metallopeptidase domain
MFDVFHPGESIPWDYLWQSTLFLSVGLAASFALVRRPARAHRLLLLAVLATMCTPLLARAARHGGWGLLAHRAEPATSRIAVGPIEPPALADRSPIAPIEGASPSARPEMPAMVPALIERPEVASVPGPMAGESLAESPIDWVTMAFFGWLILSGLAVVRLLGSLPMGLRAVRRARSVADETLAGAAAAAAARLGLGATPVLRTSPRVRCPAIWCWGRRPIILLPESTSPTSAPVDWVGVFCHELAHWVRKDHWSGLLAEVIVCLLPWHPLAWLARHRLNQLSELACDDWALAAGVAADDYAESLLGLVPQRRPALALSAVSSRRGLIGRIRHILDERRIVPSVGRRWAFASAAIVALAASAVALAQTRPSASKDEKPKDDRAAASRAPSTPSEKSTAKRRVIRGQVLKPDGSPAAGARVLWVGEPKAQLPISALPKGQRARMRLRAETLADTSTDAEGRFEVAAEFDPDRYDHEDGFAAHLVVAFPGVGLLSRRFKDDATEVMLRLAPQVPIRGRLLTPGGAPAAGVRVVLENFNDGESEGLGFASDLPDDGLPSYWLRPRTTDADGRFTFEGVPEGTYAQLEFQHPDYATDEVTVNAVTRGGIKAMLSAWTQGFELAPVKPDFTHTLEPSRPVQGRVTDKATGKPLAGLVVEMIPMRRHGGMPFYTRTDADGRYRIAGHQADQYVTTVFPSAESAYLSVKDWHMGWPAGARYLEKNFALTKGKIVHGRVIDTGTNRPIAGAAVAYQPKRGNPNNNGDYDLRNPVVTDAEGRFAITALPGPGILAVETTDRNNMRVAVDADVPGGRAYPQGVASIDVPKDGEPPAAEVLVRKGVTLQVRVLDPDGQPARGIVGTCEGIDAKHMDVWNQGQPFADGVFKMPGADPSRTYRVYFLHPDRKLGAFVDVKPHPQGGVAADVRVQPTAKVHGKVVTTSGSPVPGGQVYPAIVTDDLSGKMSRQELLMKLQNMNYTNLLGQRAMMLYWTRLRSDAKGEFVIDTLLPGVPLYMTANAARQEAFVPMAPLKPGEDRDLGTITLKEFTP